MVHYDDDIMSDPRFVPNRCSFEPQSFGRAKNIEWRQAASADAVDRIEAAKMQHKYAVLIRQRAIARFGSVKAFSDGCDVPYDRLTKILRGAAIMRFEDLAQAERLLGDLSGAI